MSVREQDNKYAINVADVTKIYRLYEKPIGRLKESMSISHKNYHRDFYALNQFSLRVKKGETMGIIGTNGSGRSIILKIITGVLIPTAGEVKVDGKISALLELRAGFNMDYTGIENIYMNDTIVGYTEKEMDAELQDILEFMEIGDFVYQPVRTYPSDMFIRLTSVLTINVDPEILIVDEALSVGDMFFQPKRYHRMEKVRQRGTIIPMVTHDMGSTIKYHGRAALLDKGELIAEGPASYVVDMYKKVLTGQLGSLEAELERGGQQKESLSGGSGQEDTDNGQHTQARAEGKETTRGQAGAGTKSGDVEISDFSGSMGLERSRLMEDQLAIDYDRTEYGDGRTETVDPGLFDERGNATNLLLKGGMFATKEQIHFNTGTQSSIFTYTIKDKKDTELIGTNTMFEGADIQSVKREDEYVVEFTQKMTPQGGGYLLNMSCTGFEQSEHTVYHRLCSVANITVTFNEDTIGMYDMGSGVKAEKMEARNTQTGSVRPTMNGGL